MDLGLILIANVIMRTRLPPNKHKNNNSSVAKEIATDAAYLLYIAGTFFVSQDIRFSQIQPI